MTKLTDSYNALREMGAVVPEKNLMDKPINWVHFGGGNLFRCFHASIQQDLVNQGLSRTSVALIETFDDELIEKVYKKYALRSLEVVLRADGSFYLGLLDSVREALFAGNESDYKRAKKLFESPDLQLVTLSITEKGYSITNLSGEVLPAVKDEMNAGPNGAKTAMGFLASLMYWRFKAGAAPIALCSTDNFSHNGDKLKDAILQIVNVWVQKGFTEKEFLNYLNSEKVSFPLSMIDRITPLPSAKVAAELDSIGFEDTEIVKTSKGTASAAFVNTEETHYLVIEDKFPNGRPPLEKADVIITSRDKVDKVEKMKVCTCLNPLHTSLAIFGCLLGANSISGEMKNPDLVKLVERIGYDEGLPVVVNPEIIDPKSFLDEVLQKRLPNPNIPDTPQRIATDTSQKLPIRFGETIKSYISENRDISQLKGIAFTFAGWIRYLMAVDDSGNAFERSPDPLLDELDKYIKPLKLGSPDCESVKKLLHDKTIFGVDLYEAKTGGSSSESSLADMTIAYLKEMLTGPGAIAAALKKHFG